MASESDKKVPVSETSSGRSRWLDGTNVKAGTQEEPSEVPVKAKPKVPPQGLAADPWEGQQLRAEPQLEQGGEDPWAKYHNAKPQSTEAEWPSSTCRRGFSDDGERRSVRDPRDPNDIPVIFGPRSPFRRPRGLFDVDERISHCMARFLRYRSAYLGKDDDGFVELPSLLEEVAGDLPGTTAEDLHRVALSSASRLGRRFDTREIQSADGKVLTLVRAAYRHMDDAPFSRGGRRRDMFRQPAGSWLSPTAQEVKRDRGHFVMSSPRERKEDRDIHYEIEDQFAALQADSPYADVAKAHASKSDASASTEATSSSQEEVWERFLEPVTLRPWFWNPKTEEVLYPDELEDGWQMFFTEEGQRWFWQEATGRYFFEELSTEE
ncbi:unnamed protein product [Durusdinium trenchii]|uniref:Uncharacterized protein n=2 Tax=Durusdinium trenchii TaxID=1381693 RepID=A0ABP0MU81_9DINO